MVRPPSGRAGPGLLIAGTCVILGVAVLALSAHLTPRTG